MSAVFAAVFWLPTSVVAAGEPACPNEAFRSGRPSGSLPDCRAFELVSPVEKNGYAAVNEGYPSRATPDGEGLAYLSFGAFAGAASGSLPGGYVSRRGAEGWSTSSVSPPNPDPTPPGSGIVTYDFSSDLSRAVVKVPLQSLAEGAPSTTNNLFLDDGGPYQWINHSPPPLELPQDCPLPSLEANCFQFVDLVTFAGASVDFRHVLFEARANAADPEDFETLYRSDFDGQTWHVSLAGVLPDGEPAPAGSTAGSGSSAFYSSTAPSADARVANAISADGTLVTFQAISDEGTVEESGQSGTTQLYQRTESGQTVELSLPAPGAKPANPTPQSATFWAASTDARRVFFTSPGELTTQSNTGAAGEGVDLYEYDSRSGTGKLRDLTVDPTGAGAEVLGVLDASADGSYVYFVARGQLEAGKGVAGEPNLYVAHEGGVPTFIATLAPGGAEEGGDAEDWTPSAALRESYVTPDGAHVAFTSTRSLPTANFPNGYDNHSASEGEAEREVYLYSAATAELVCASCDPDGSPPVGPGLLGGVRRPGAKGVSQSSPFHAVRSVSADGGRVFFSSQDPLVASVAPGDTEAKVYEYERAGKGTCTAAGGCVSLLSSPDPEAETVFLDADEEGDAVFMNSFDRLAPADPDNLPDVFVARVDGGFPEATSPPVCTGDDCRGAGTSPGQAIGVATPVFRGPGNLHPKVPRPCAKAKVRRHRRCVRLKPHHPRRHRHRRRDAASRRHHR